MRINSKLDKERQMEIVRCFESGYEEEEEP
jgi:hypothetical protein